MTSTSPLPGGMEGNMDVDEIAVRQHLDTAVGGSTPDVVSLVAGGITVGRGMRRRRRITQALAGVAGCAAVVTLLTTLGGVGDLFTSERTGPADDPTDVVQLVPATPRGLAAAVISHSDELGTLISAGGFPLNERNDGSTSEPGMRGAMLVGLGYKSRAGDLTELQVVASPEAEHWEKVGLCRQVTPPSGSCTQDALPDGTPRAVVELSPVAGTDPEGSPERSMLAVGILRPDQFVIVIQTVTGTLRNGMDIEGLQEIATDPAVGVSTTAALNAEGEQLEDFIDSSAGMFGGGGSDSASESEVEVGPESGVESAPAPSQDTQGSDDGGAGTSSD